MRQAAIEIRRAAVALAIVVTAVVAAGTPARAGERASIVVRYTISPAGHDAISVSTDAGQAAARRVAQAAVAAAGAAARAGPALLVVDRNDGPVIQTIIHGRLPAREGNRLRLTIAADSLGSMADQLGRPVVIELCLPKIVDRDMTGLRVVRESSVLHCFNGGEAAVATLTPGGQKPARVGVVLHPSFALASGVWLGLWLAAVVFTLAFWGVARGLRRWLVPRRATAARVVGIGVGVVVAATGAFFSFAIGAFVGPAFNVAYTRPDGTGALAAIGLASLAPGAIAGIVFATTLMPRYLPVPIVPWQGQPWVPPPPVAPYGLPPPAASADPRAAAFPSWWEPVASPPPPPPPPPRPPMPWVPAPVPLPAPAPERDMIPRESGGRLALLLGWFGGALPIVGGAGAVLAGRRAAPVAPRRAGAAQVLGIVQLIAWPIAVVLCLLPL